jgi:hypothetical protein
MIEVLPPRAEAADGLPPDVPNPITSYGVRSILRSPVQGPGCHSAALAVAALPTLELDHVGITPSPEEAGAWPDCSTGPSI